MQTAGNLKAVGEFWLHIFASFYSTLEWYKEKTLVSWNFWATFLYSKNDVNKNKYSAFIERHLTVKKKSILKAQNFSTRGEQCQKKSRESGENKA